MPRSDDQQAAAGHRALLLMRPDIGTRGTPAVAVHRVMTEFADRGLASDLDRGYRESRQRPMRRRPTEWERGRCTRIAARRHDGHARAHRPGEDLAGASAGFVPQGLESLIRQAVRDEMQGVVPLLGSRWRPEEANRRSPQGAR